MAHGHNCVAIRKDCPATSLCVGLWGNPAPRVLPGPERLGGTAREHERRGIGDRLCVFLVLSIYRRHVDVLKYSLLNRAVLESSIEWGAMHARTCCEPAVDLIALHVAPEHNAFQRSKCAST